MTEQISIGPVTISGQAHLFDGNKFTFEANNSKTIANGNIIFQKGTSDRKESFQMICDFHDAKSIQGIMEIGEPVWINTSYTLSTNDYFDHQGWYMIDNVDIEHLSPALVKLTVDISLISVNPYEWITVDYTTGFYDGLTLPYTYNPTTISYQIQDPMTSFSSTYWDTTVYGYNAGTKTCVSDGNELDFTIASNTDGQWSCAWVKTKNKYYPPFYAETVLDRNTLPGAGAYPASVAFGMSKELLVPNDISALYKNSRIEWFYVQWLCNNTSTTHEVSVSKSGQWTLLYPFTNKGTAKEEVKIRIYLQLNGNCTVTTALGTGGVFDPEVVIYKGWCNVQNLQQGVYFYLYTYNQDSTNFVGSFQYLNVYNYVSDTPDYVVLCPGNDTGVSVASTGYIETEDDSTTRYWTNPTVETAFRAAYAGGIYDSSVKLLSTNFADGTSRMVYNKDHVLDPDKTILKNGLTRLVFNANGFDVYGYESGTWNLINSFTGNGWSLSQLKILTLNHDEVVLQIRDSVKLRMLRSSPVVTLYHPTLSFNYTLKDRYYHDGVTTSSPGAGATISMTDTAIGYAANIYNNASPTYRLLIGKQDPTNILSDNIPMDTVTGIGWVKAGATGIEGASSRIQQWWKQTRTKLSWKSTV